MSMAFCLGFLGVKVLSLSARSDTPSAHFEKGTWLVLGHPVRNIADQEGTQPHMSMSAEEALNNPNLPGMGDGCWRK